MMLDPHDDAIDATDPVLDALLRRADRDAPAVELGRVEARIRSQSAFLLAARRRNARTSMADTLAVWVRVALPLAAAAALFAALTLARLDTTLLAEAELSDSDPAALLSALESEGSSGLARHLIAPDAETQTPDDGTSR